MNSRLTNPRYYFILLLGLTAGVLFTVASLLQEWLGITFPYQQELFACLFWAGMISVFLYGVILFQRNPTLSKTYIFVFVAIGMMLVYLFPTYLTPGCGGMPRALAARECHDECTTVCTNWKPRGSPGCNPPNPWDEGCCFSYAESCTRVCTGSDDPPPPSYSPPTATAALNCTLPGSAGWCRAGASITINASDPQGFGTTITGDINGANFSCSGPTCTRSLPEGSGTIHYQATAATSNLSSAVGTSSFAYDPTAPTATLSKVGTAGSNGWYISNVTVSDTGTDATSGLGSTLVSANGGSWQTSISLSNGTHTVQGQTTDKAGNQTVTSTQTVKVDTVAPSQTIAITSGTPGGSGYYVSNITLTASPSDVTSGVALTQSRVDGGAWTTGVSTTISTDGTHVVEFRTTDNAGLSTTGSQTVKLDKTPPAIILTPTGTAGSNGWYLSTVSLALSATDATSGASTLEYSLNGGTTWTAGTSVTLTDGISTVNVRSTDVAGNQATSLTTIKVDTVAPALAVNLSGTDGSNSWYVSSVGLAAITSDATSGVALTEYRVDSGSWTTGTNVTVGADGSHKVDFRVTDNAGNQSTTSDIFQVDQTSPISSFSQNGTDGEGDWYVSTVVITVNNSDLTSGVASVAYRLDGGAWTAGSSLTIADGVHTIDSRVIDSAGNQKIDSVTVKVDITPPTAPIGISATLGKAGWYVSDVDSTTTPGDALSGVQITEYRVDGGAWLPGSSVITTGDGSHVVDYRVTDRAGLQTTTTQSFKIDQTQPISLFTSPVEGSSSELIRGFYTLLGHSNDVTSGLSGVEISLNNGNSWQPVTGLLPTGDWLFGWETSQLPNGSYTVLARAQDVAGNTEHTARVTVILANRPPLVKVQDSWWIWESGKLSVTEQTLPVHNISLTIGCGSQRKVELNFSSTAKVPSPLQWDRRCGDGHLAEVGDHSVTLRACDIYGTCASDTGTIKIPIIALIAPATWTATPVVTPTRTPAATSKALPSPTPTVFYQPAKVPDQVQPEPVAKPVPLYLWPAFGFMGLLMALSSASLADRRPDALRRLAGMLKRRQH